MEQIEQAQARDHIEMVDRILAESSQRLCFGGEYFLVWGLYSALVGVLWQLVGNHVLPHAALWAQAPLAAAAVIFSLVRGRQKKAVELRRSIVEREFFNVLWLTLGLAFVMNVAAFRLFSGWGMFAIWSFAEAIVLLFIGMHGNRRAQLAGIVVVASLIAANFTQPTISGYILGAGMLGGYAGFGLAEMLARD